MPPQLTCITMMLLMTAKTSTPNVPQLAASAHWRQPARSENI
jgi:hypothetical protein